MTGGEAPPAALQDAAPEIHGPSGNRLHPRVPLMNDSPSYVLFYFAAVAQAPTHHLRPSLSISLWLIGSLIKPGVEGDTAS